MENRVLRRSGLLQRLGITQWQLRHPIALQGEEKITILATVRLVLVADPVPSLAHVLLKDILRALNLTEKQVCCLLPEQMTLLPNHCLCWALGDCKVSSDGSLIRSPSLDQLQFNAQAKRQLWQQICLYADYFSLTAQ